MRRVTNSRMLLCALVLLFTAASCTEAIDDGPADPSPDTGQHDAGEPDVDASDDIDENDDPPEELSYEDCIADEEFAKPDVDTDGTRVYDDDEFTPGDGMGQRRRLSARPPEVIGKGDQSWVDEGDHYIFDNNIWIYGVDYLPRDYEFFVLHEGERLPFKIAVVDDGDDEFVSTEELEDWSEDDYGTQETLTVEEETTLSFTLVIPSWAFDKPGSYPVQTIGVPVWEPAEQIGDVGWRVARYMPFDRGFYIHYGSECPLPNTGDHPRPPREDEVDYWTEWEVSNFAFQFLGRFLAPPRELYDWTEVSGEDWRSDVELDQVFESPEPEVTVELYLADLRDLGRGPPLAEETLYYVLRDGEVIDTFLFDDVPIVNQNDWYYEEDPGVVLPVDIELTEELATYEVRMVPNPYDTYDHDEAGEMLDEDGMPLLPWQFDPFQTIALQMKYVPDKD